MSLIISPSPAAATVTNAAGATVGAPATWDDTGPGQLSSKSIPLRLCQLCSVRAGVDGARATKAQQTSGKSPTVLKSKVSAWLCALVLLSGPGAVTCWWSGTAEQAVRCHFSSQRGCPSALGSHFPLWGSASSSVK